ncbi:hypothetical protein [Mycolicibacter sinensis]|uniref:Transmembrane protein n=1 Tax=Mycolicibacter sinensis (strain JDM601) TaxID=875328 RepID=A0A1A2EBM4_MYCSD|nr:hypothetical protein [Mycolicibacter sinensis]OBG00297.1 hypothetical protein A5772_11295 [Mycolicibacter sinensis]OBG02166.1 hypothetical protein A5771_15590 [Mycolicibacter sinensis]
MTDRHQPPTGANPFGNDPASAASRIIRRAPTGAIPVVTGAQQMPPAMRPHEAPRPGHTPSAAVPISACVFAIIGCWATSVVSTDLIASWWHTDRLFCVAVAFLSLVFAGTTVTGVIMLLLRRPVGRYLIAIGAVVALLTFGSLFLAGARVPGIVHTIPFIQAATVVAALHPATKRWLGLP